MADLLTRYKASMVLLGVGDALGYRNERWEYCTSGPTIHSELNGLGGVASIHVALPDWRVSDDTVMSLATADGLILGGATRDSILPRIARQYKLCMSDMVGRKPGPSSIAGTDQLRPDEPSGWNIGFTPTGTGCGAAMRSMPIGLRYSRTSDIDLLIEYSVEAGRMTHHHPIGYLGSVASALFVSYAIQGKPLVEWGRCLVNDVIPKALDYVTSTGLEVESNIAEWPYFQNKWKLYLQERGILSDDQSGPCFPDNHDDVATRDLYYKSLSMDGWAGRSGHDAPMIAYDALLSYDGTWADLCSRSMFHAGDSDSTGVIAAACYGARNGFTGVPQCNYNQLEYRERLEKAAVDLYNISTNL